MKKCFLSIISILAMSSVAFADITVTATYTDTQENIEFFAASKGWTSEDGDVKVFVQQWGEKLLQEELTRPITDYVYETTTTAATEQAKATADAYKADVISKLTVNVE